jgi:hypothetical protein
MRSRAPISSRLSLRTAVWLGVVLVLIATVACERGTSPDGTTSTSLLVVTPDSVRLASGDSTRLTVLMRAANRTVPMPADWTSADPSIASVSSTGVVHAVGPRAGRGEDTVWVTGTAGDFLARVHVVVVSRGPVSSRGVGINLGTVADWSAEWPFVDVFRTSRAWISQRQGAAWGEGGPLALTVEGWVASLEPGQYAMTPMFSDGSGRYPEGEYVVLYQGNGTLDFPLSPGVTVLQSAPGRVVVRVIPSPTTPAPLWLSLMATDPANPVRDIRVIIPGYEATYATQPFNPALLERLRPFGVIRFMDWQATNHSPIRTWAERATLQSATFTGPRGVALETMIALANATGADPWFCMPHLADDDYVRQFAEMVRLRLDPGLRVHVEYSNEVWNSLFEQSQYATQRGQELGLSTDAYQGAMRFYSQRAVEIFAIWRQVFGPDSLRVVRVLGSQAGNVWVSQQVLGWRDAFRQADVLAIAPYTDGGLSRADPTTIGQMTVDQVLDAMDAQVVGPLRTMLDAQAQEARAAGVQLVAYEGGQHLVSAQFPATVEPSATQLFTAANRDPRMRDVYTRLFDTWNTAGGGLFLPYNLAGAWTRFGSWGALEYISQDPTTSPKYQAITEFAARAVPD